MDAKEETGADLVELVPPHLKSAAAERLHHLESEGLLSSVG
jgi:hypothetical protein